MLKDTYRKKGSNFNVFQEEYRLFASTLKMRRVSKEDIELLSYYHTEDEKYLFRVLNSETLTQFQLFNKPMKLIVVKANKLSPDRKALFEECINTSGLMLGLVNRDKWGNVTSRDYMFLSTYAIKGLSEAAGVGGIRCKERDLGRDFHIATNLMYNNKKVTLLYRENKIGDNTNQKVFAVVKERFVPEGVDLMPSIVKKAGKEQLKTWMISQENTHVNLLLHTYNNNDLYFFPILKCMVEGSNFGQGSLSVYKIFQITEDDIVITDVKRFRHVTVIEPDDVVAEIQITEEDDKFVNNLVELADIPVETESVTAFIKKILKTVPEIRRIIGKFREKAFLEELDITGCTTKYDVACKIFSVYSFSKNNNQRMDSLGSEPLKALAYELHRIPEILMETEI